MSSCTLITPTLSTPQKLDIAHPHTKKLPDSDKLTIFLTSIFTSIAAYFSISDCAGLSFSTKELYKYFEKDGWNIYALQSGLLNKCPKDISENGMQSVMTGKQAVIYDLKEEYLSYYRFNQFMRDIGTKSDINDFETEEFRTLKDSIFSQPFVSLSEVKLASEESNLLLRSFPKREIWFSRVSRIPNDLSVYSLRKIGLVALTSCLSIPGWILLAKGLEHLSLMNLGLKIIPSAIQSCTNLQVLNLGNLLNEDGNNTRNQIREIPLAIMRLPKLCSLNLENNSLTVLPSRLIEFKTLTQLTLSANPLGKLPEDFSRLEALNRLAIDNIGLNHWPTAILKLPNLISLSITLNHIEEIPYDVRKWLFNLNFLNSRDNPWSSESQMFLRTISTHFEDIQNGSNKRSRLKNDDFQDKRQRK